MVRVGRVGDGEDTACVRVHTDAGAEILFLSTLCGEGGVDRTDTDVYGDRGRAHWSFQRCLVESVNGYRLDLETARTPTMVAFGGVVDRLAAGERPLVTPEEARNHVIFSNGAYTSCAAIQPIAREWLRVEALDGGGVSTEIVGMGDLIERPGAEQRLFSEPGVPWARRGEPVDVRDYRRFAPGF